MLSVRFQQTARKRAVGSHFVSLVSLSLSFVAQISQKREMFGGVGSLITGENAASHDLINIQVRVTWHCHV